MFQRLDTVILRVVDVERAEQWYRSALGLDVVHRDDAQRLRVMGVGEAGLLTLWQRRADEIAPDPAAAGTYPILATADAPAARARLIERGVEVSALEDGGGVRWFWFRDPDGNRLEACQVLA